jgi:hypothetical protein
MVEVLFPSSYPTRLVISFWHDVWCGIEPLQHSFSDLYAID